MNPHKFPLPMVIAIAAVTGLAIRFTGNGEKRFTVADLTRQNLRPVIRGAKWFLLDPYNAKYEIKKAITVDGAVAAEKISNITPDGDVFNLRIQGRTRHAKWLVVEPLKA